MANSVTSKHDMHNQVIEQSTQGLFSHHQAARTVLLFYVHRVWLVDSRDRNIKNCVMRNCIQPAVVASSTGLTRDAVHKANIWLEEEDFIQAVRDDNRQVTQIRLTWDDLEPNSENPGVHSEKTGLHSQKTPLHSENAPLHSEKTHNRTIRENYKETSNLKPSGEEKEDRSLGLPGFNERSEF